MEEKKGNKEGNENKGEKVGDVYKAVAIQVKIRLKKKESVYEYKVNILKGGFS